MIKIIMDILTDENFVGAIFTSLSFIFVGFILRRKNIINNNGKEFLTIIVLKIALPAMAFSAFMTEFNSAHFIDNFLVFIISLLFYIIFIMMGHLVLFKIDQSKRIVISIFMAVGQLTFFSIPVLKTIYSDSYSKIMIPANMMTLSFRLILYIYCYFAISKLKFNKEKIKFTLKSIFLNPIMISMAIGLFIWVTQEIMPKANIDDEYFSIFRIDKTLPGIYMIISTAEKLTTPLAMMIIGCILGEAHIKEAFKDKYSWLIAIARTIIIPIMTLLFLVVLQMVNIINFDEYTIMIMVIGFGAPLSAVVSTYCSKFNNEMELSSRVCFLSTLLSILTFPILFIIVKVVVLLPIF